MLILQRKYFKSNMFVIVKIVMKIVIAALVRGYEETASYSSLIKRNKYIKKNITSKINCPYELLIFHEGNIPEEHQQYINSKSPEVYNFIDVSEDFKYDKSIISEVPDLERFNIGYRLMCRFNFFHIWKYVNKYDFLIRIDEDVIVKKFSKSLLDNLNNNFIFGTADLSSESHEYTNISLPEELKKIFDSTNTDFYNHLFPYTNFYISNIEFWNNNDIQILLREISNNKLQLIHRWGDLPIIGSILNFKNIEIKILKGISYSHLSHKNRFKITKKIKS